jgi:hypothetical protein
MFHDGNSIGRGNLHMEIPWTGPNFKWKFHGEGLIKNGNSMGKGIFTRKFHGKG